MLDVRVGGVHAAAKAARMSARRGFPQRGDVTCHTRRSEEQARDLLVKTPRDTSSNPAAEGRINPPDDQPTVRTLELPRDTQFVPQVSHSQ